MRLIWFSRLALLADASEEADVCLRSTMAITDELKNAGTLTDRRGITYQLR